MHTIAHDGPRARHGVPRLQRAQLPAARAPVPGARRARRSASEMSFSVCCDRCALEYSGRRPFAQPRNAAEPALPWRSLWEIGRWLRTARRSLDEADYERHSLGAFLDERGYSQRFRRHFLVPLTSALWSTAPGRALEFPAAYAIRFFDHHGMLGLRPLPLAHGERRVAHVRPRALRAARRPGLQLGLGVRSLRRDARRRRADGRRRGASVASTRWWSPRTPTRRSGCSPTRATRSGASSARSGTPTNEAVLHTDSVAPPARPRGPRLLELPRSATTAGRRSRTT